MSVLFIAISVAVLALYFLLWLLFWYSSAMLNITDNAGLVWLSLGHGMVTWAILETLLNFWPTHIGQGRTVLRRWVAALALLLPVYETVQIAVPLRMNTSHPGDLHDVGTVALSAASASLACLFWELGFSDRPRSVDAANEKKQQARALLARVVRYSTPDYLYLAAAFLFLALAAWGETYIPVYIGQVIDILRDSYDQSSFLTAIVFMGVYSIGSSLFGGLRGGMFMCCLCRLNKRVRHLLFQNLMRQEITFFEEHKPGSLSSRLISDTDKMGRSVAMNVNVLLRSLVKTVAMLRLMLGLSWELTLLACVEMPLTALLQNFYNSLSQELSQQLNDCQAEAVEVASEVVGAVRTVRSLHGEQQETQRYQNTLGNMLCIKRRKGIYSALHLLLKRVMTVGLKVLMLLRGRDLITSQQLSMGSLLSFFLFQKDMTTNMKHLVYIYGDMLNTVTSSVKVFQLLDREPKMKAEGDLAPSQLVGTLALHNITFSYPSRPDTLALKDVTLEVQAGRMTALVGFSGSGKSTCVSLLQHLYEPQDGDVLLDGQPLHQYQHRYLRSKMAVVSQDPVLFAGSISYNIGYGLQGSCSEEEVQEAAKRACAHGFISKLKNGYDTCVGECGSELSAGQKQCIAIARALVRRPQILILDEATSCMDVNTQHAVQAVLDGSEGQTLLVIAHRLQTVQRASHIIFMDHGEVVEQGTHQELMAMRGHYYSQFQHHKNHQPAD